MTLLMAVAVYVYPLSFCTEFSRLSGFELAAKALKVKCTWNLWENCTRENWENHTGLGAGPRLQNPGVPPTSFPREGEGEGAAAPFPSLPGDTPGSWDAGTASS